MINKLGHFFLTAVVLNPAIGLCQSRQPVPVCEVEPKVQLEFYYLDYLVGPELADDQSFEGILYCGTHSAKGSAYGGISGRLYAYAGSSWSLIHPSHKERNALPDLIDRMKVKALPIANAKIEELREVGCIRDFPALEYDPFERHLGTISFRFYTGGSPFEYCSDGLPRFCRVTFTKKGESWESAQAESVCYFR